MKAREVLNFWFQELTETQWFTKDAQVDQTIQDRFLKIHKEAAQDQLKSWRETPSGRLAEIIVLDQFSRNLFRDSAQAFAQDAKALELAKEMIQKKLDRELPVKERAFVYMPFMHSERIEDHQKAVELFNVEGMENNYKFEVLHRDIIQKFGRYPHRNEILGRKSSPEEIEFLNQPNSSF